MTRTITRLKTAQHSLKIVCFREVSDAREQIERELDALGSPLPLAHRSPWARQHEEPGRESWLFGAIDEETRQPLAGVGVTITQTRALPGHRILRAERLSPCRDDVARHLLDAIREEVARDKTVLRFEIALFGRDGADREATGRWLASRGYRRAVEPRLYEKTSVVDLSPDHDAIFAGFHSTARRHARAAVKKGLALRVIDDERVADDLRALVVETRARTGGEEPDRDWAARIRLGREHPGLVRTVGLFRADGSLVAFASGTMQGDHAVYADAASTRAADLRIPLGYALAWDLMQWAKEAGATWFDFGGITDGNHDDATDPLGGISDFKRYFRGPVVRISDEWIYEPHFIRAALARSVSAGATWLRSRRRSFTWSLAA